MIQIQAPQQQAIQTSQPQVQPQVQQQVQPQVQQVQIQQPQQQTQVYQQVITPNGVQNVPVSLHYPRKYWFVQLVHWLYTLQTALSINEKLYMLKIYWTI